MKILCTWFAKIVGCSQGETLKKGTEEVKKTPFFNIEFKNDSERLRKEFKQLLDKNNPLRELLLDLSEYVNDRYGKKLVITMIYRTDEEQDSIYQDDSRYQERKFKSPHQFWHGADLRSKIFTDEEIQDIEIYLNRKYNSDNYYDWTAKNHNVGLGDHFHIQYYEV